MGRLKSLTLQYHSNPINDTSEYKGGGSTRYPVLMLPPLLGAPKNAKVSDSTHFGHPEKQGDVATSYFVPSFGDQREHRGCMTTPPTSLVATRQG